MQSLPNETARTLQQGQNMSLEQNSMKMDEYIKSSALTDTLFLKYLLYNNGTYS